MSLLLRMASFLRNVPHDQRPQHLGDRHGQVPPDTDGCSILRIVGVQLGQRAVLVHQILPVQLYRRGTPLYLEVIGSSVGSRPPEIKLPETALDRKTNRFPVEHMIGAEWLVVLDR